MPVSPKPPWGEAPFAQEAGEPSFSWVDVALWLPNRLMDFIDIFRFDIGIGPAHGAVVRITKYAQAGYRRMTPGSLRLGDFGRRPPAMIEEDGESGVSPYYRESSDRPVCPGEIGAGADLLAVGAYGGVCVDELADFVAGIFFIDLKEDDLR